MEMDEFQNASNQIKDEPQSDGEASQAMEFVEIDGSQLVQCKREVEEDDSEEIIASLELKLKDVAQSNADGDFLVPITDQEYLAISVRKIFFMAQLTKLVKGYCGKSLRLFKVCNGCGFKAIQEKDMAKHLEDGSGSCHLYHHALGTFEEVVYVLQCCTCFYRSNVRYNVVRHQQKKGHVGIRKVRADSKIDDEIDNAVEALVSDKSQEIIANLQLKLTHEAKNCQQKGFALRLSKEELETIHENKTCFTKFKQIVKSYCERSIQLIQVCDKCAFKTITVEKMSQHFGSGTCSGFFDAIGTCPVQYRRVQVLQCNTCGYKSDQIGNMQRHQATQGHEGFVKSKPPRPDEYQSAADQTDEDDPTTRVKPCPHCGQEMQARNLGRHARLYCAVLLKKPAKLGTDYDVPEDEHGLPVLKCEDCGKSFHHYYYMKKHLENGCPVLKRLAKGAGADGKQLIKRKYELPKSEFKFREVVPLECEVKVEEQ